MTKNDDLGEILCQIFSGRTFDLVPIFASFQDEDGPSKRRREKLGNDLDELDIGPDFQV
jgi:hypothetical protein